MKHSNKISIIIFIAILFSLISPVPVYADEGTPPPPTEEIIEEEIVETEDSTTIDESIPEIASTADVEPVSETLSQLPENTEVIVLDENGEVEPLVTEEAEEIILVSDPMWCPTGQTPGGVGCTASYMTVTDLIANLGSKSGAGTVYFTAIYSTNDAVFDHTNPNLAGLTDLTIQGGWNGLTGNSFSLSGNTVFDGVSVGVYWNNAVTIKNVSINGATDNALDVYTKGNIKINNLTVENTQESSCCSDITNINIISEGNITITNVNIQGSNEQGEVGLIVAGGGNIKLNNVTSNENGSAGIVIWGGDTISLNSITTNDNKSLFWSQGTGIVIYSNAPVTLSNITANNNEAIGIAIGYPNDIKMKNVTVNNNGLWDIFLYSDDSYLNLQISCSWLWMPIYISSSPEQKQIVTLNNVIMQNNGDDFIIGADSPTIIKKNEGCNTRNNDVDIDKDNNLSVNLIKNILVTNSQSVNFDCKIFMGTTLILSNSKVTFNCPIIGSASLSVLENENLPAALPEGVEYISGLVAVPSPDGSDVALDGLVVVSFIIPDGMQDEDFAILYWNGAEWVDLDTATFDDGRTVFNGGYVTEDGYFEAFTNFSGNFVLVKK